MVAGTIMDNRRVTAPVLNDLGYVRQGIALPAGINHTLSTTGGRQSIHTYNSLINPTSADTNGINLTGTTTFRFGLDGLTQNRTFSGTPSTLGIRTGYFITGNCRESGLPVHKLCKRCQYSVHGACLQWSCDMEWCYKFSVGHAHQLDG